MTQIRNSTDGTLSSNLLTGSKSLDRLRAELIDPFSSVLGLCQLMQLDVSSNDAPEALRDDVFKLFDYSRTALCTVRSMMKEDTDEDCQQSSSLPLSFHDILNHVGFIRQQSDLMMLLQHEEYFPSLAGDLTEIISKCDGLVATILKYKRQESESGSAEVLTPACEPGNKKPISNILDRPKILIIDDKQENCDLGRRVLEGMGCECVTSLSGKHGLEILRQDDSIDIVLLDYMMPEMNGYEVLLEIKKDQQLKSVSVIIVSALEQTEHVADCIESGADDFLPKPINSRLLQARISSCLKRRQLTEQEYSQFFPPSVARSYVRNPKLRNVAKQAEVSVLFCDIRNFSTICEAVGTTEIVQWLGEVVTWIADCVIKNDGVIVDFVGDEVMAMWGAPEPSTNHAEQACKAALEIMEALPEISQEWENKIGYRTELGIGINTGIASVGNSGSRHRFKYGPLGSTVNVASRVQGATKHFRTPLLVTQETRDRLPASVVSRRVGSVRVMNVVEPVVLYDAYPDHKLSRQDLIQYEQALDAFEAGALDQSTMLLGELLTRIPDDGPALILMLRIAGTKLGRHELNAVLELDSK